MLLNRGILCRVALTHSITRWLISCSGWVIWITITKARSKRREMHYKESIKVSPFTISVESSKREHIRWQESHDYIFHCRDWRVGHHRQKSLSLSPLLLRRERERVRAQKKCLDFGVSWEKKKLLGPSGLYRGSILIHHPASSLAANMNVSWGVTEWPKFCKRRSGRSLLWSTLLESVRKFYWYSEWLQLPIRNTQ